MPLDPLLDESLGAYVDASNRYGEAVEGLCKLVGAGNPLEFSKLVARVRELKAKTKAAYAEVQEKKRDQIASDTVDESNPQ